MSSSANTAADKESPTMTFLGFILYSLGFVSGMLWKFSILLLRTAAKGFLQATDPVLQYTVSTKTKSDTPVKPIPLTQGNVKKQLPYPVILMQIDEGSSDKGGESIFTRPPVLTEVDYEDGTPFGDIPFGSEKSSNAVIRPL
ncbi:hypothetical protein JBO49_16090 [Serratia fonticola]|uniref:hypothetical protein n=1 Tax=Serratia fonticola TaxID=47917 RepID=UPI00192C6F06|nr:hypothetical protein [Serratia fonticola]MBL5862138.1 hypothetical protein [Serratia fonticola]